MPARIGSVTIDLGIELAGRLFSDMGGHADVVLHRQMLKMLLDAAGGNDRRLKLALCQRFTKLTPGKVAHKDMLILHNPLSPDFSSSCEFRLTPKLPSEPVTTQPQPIHDP